MTAIDWLDSLSPWPRDGFGLERMRALLAELGNPQEAYPAIHVVGTNGKSTATVAIEQLLLGDGLSVGSTISPHVASWSERIRVDGAEADFEAAVARVRPASERLDATQFEIVTAAALAAFAHAEVDVAVVEAGLGGRLDATNVLRTRVVLLTNVSLEHTDVLGDTVEAIAAREARGRARRVRRRPSRPHLRQPRPRTRSRDRSARTRRPRRSSATRFARVPAPALPGRFERREGEIRDGAHNPDGVRYLVERIRDGEPRADFTVVVSILADKDADEMLRELRRVGSRLVATRSSSDRALPAEQVAELARAHFDHVEAIEDPGGGSGTRARSRRARARDRVPVSARRSRRGGNGTPAWRR